MATVVNYEIDQGTTFERVLTFTDADGAVYDLTGCSLSGQLRRQYSDDTIAASFTFAINSTTGEVVMTLTAASTTAIEAATYVYDVELITSANKTIRCFEGKIKLNPEVTR